MPYKDKERQKEAQRKHYQDNKDSYRKRIAARFKGLKAWLKSLKSGKTCVNCGFDDSRCFDYHHVDELEKKFRIAGSVKRYSKKEILEEISKCVLLCANCHAIEHWEEEKESYYRDRLSEHVRWFREYKRNLTCEMCKISDHRVLTFHHVGEKEAEITKMVYGIKPIEDILEEISKCRVLCHNCHRIVHNGNEWRVA